MIFRTRTIASPPLKETANTRQLTLNWWAPLCPLRLQIQQPIDNFWFTASVAVLDLIADRGWFSRYKKTSDAYAIFSVQVEVHVRLALHPESEVIPLNLDGLPVPGDARLCRLSEPCIACRWPTHKTRNRRHVRQEISWSHPGISMSHLTVSV